MRLGMLLELTLLKTLALHRAWSFWMCVVWPWMTPPPQSCLKCSQDCRLLLADYWHRAMDLETLP